MQRTNFHLTSKGRVTYRFSPPVKLTVTPPTSRTHPLTHIYAHPQFQHQSFQTLIMTFPPREKETICKPMTHLIRSRSKNYVMISDKLQADLPCLGSGHLYLYLRAGADFEEEPKSFPARQTAQKSFAIRQVGVLKYLRTSCLPLQIHY